MKKYAAVVTCLGLLAGAQEPHALPGNAETMGMVARMAGDQVELGCGRFILRFGRRSCGERCR